LIILLKKKLEQKNSNHPSPLESAWNDDIEKEIENFAEICEKEAKNTKYKAKKQFYIGRFMQISLILLGSVSVYTSAATFDIDIKNYVNIFTGFSTTVISSIYTLFGFTKKSTIAFETSLGLDNLARMLRCELLKPIRNRKSPFELIYFSNMNRDKLIKKVGLE